MKALTVLYDERCALCVRCAVWLAQQDAYLPVDLVACGSPYARERYGEVPWLGEELVVVGDGGEVWVGPAAFLVALWALVEWRPWSYRLTGTALAPLAERFFRAISSRRRTLAALLAPDPCVDGACRVSRAYR